MTDDDLHKIIRPLTNHTFIPPSIAKNGSIPARAGEPGHAHNPDPDPRVYPRACGGTLSFDMPQGDYVGLSPRVRGNHIQREGLSLADGPIPARAGEPAIARRAGPLGRAYPRACGGTMNALQSEISVLGLSPRVRGNQHRRERFGNRQGPIPARAGEPSARTGRRERQRAYPRACGGTKKRNGPPVTVMGLSPRVRGNRATGAVGAGAGGPIPARAGEPSGMLFRAMRIRAYPRACGGTFNRVERSA